HRQRQQEQDSGGGGYDQGGYDQPPAPPPAAAAPAAPAPAAAIDYDQLSELGKLHADGTLTDEEFAAAKAKILGA
ncbi:MAG: SHOCT domain-containing protein, partial [Solirubrobacteraceae bacterium]